MHKLLVLAVILNLSLLAACSSSSEESHADQAANTETSSTHNKAANSESREDGSDLGANSEKKSPMPNSGREDYGQIGFDLMGNEKFGDLKLSLTADEAIKIIGNPSMKTEEEYWGADGGHHSNWVYKSQGITLGMNRIEDHPDSKYHNKLVDRITITAPSDLKTLKGIGIGSSLDEVKIGYQRTMENTEMEEGWLIAGTIYGGLMFKIENEQVVEIFLGASAE